ncbi:MAG: hypothetical protein KJ593_07580 [Candidatus Omnitrophica bacterium]|nr:hypothetical protein [Candidatus Omnitrophota bacterium]
MEKNNELEKIMQESMGQDLSENTINTIPVDAYVQQNFIGSSFRDKEKTEADGSSNRTRNFFIKKFHCGCYTGTIKTYGRYCDNPVPPGRKTWKEPYHILCVNCAKILECEGCGKTGDRICFTKRGQKWYCLDCLRTLRL